MPPPGAPEFSAWFGQLQRSCFRLETPQRYGGSGKDDSTRTFLASATPQPHPGKQEWMALVRAATHAGRTMQRVHVITEPLTDYVRFEVAWNYAHSVAAGEDVRIIPLTAGQPWPPDLPQPGGDFWLFDDTELFDMRYDTDGVWIGIEHITDPPTALDACRWRDTALRLAQPWATYVAERPGTGQTRTHRSVTRLNPRRARLGAALRTLREAAMPSGAELARRTGWVQPKVSRLETGMQLPSKDNLHIWAQHTGASDEQTETLINMLSTTRVEYTPIADLLRQGALALRQAHIGSMEAAATRIGEYQPAFLPGLIQTSAYSRALLELPGSARSKGTSDAQLDRIVAARTKRQELLREPGRRWQFVIGETALLSAPSGPQLQRVQLDHLVEVSNLPGVDLGMVPLRAMPVVPLSGFRLLDDEFVFVESLTGEQRLDDPDDIAPIIRVFEALRAAASSGDQAVALIQRIATELHD